MTIHFREDKPKWKVFIRDCWWTVKHFFQRQYWWVMHRTVHRYNIIKIRTLSPDYYDVDTRLLHGIFELLTGHYLREKERIARYGEKDFAKANAEWEEELLKDEKEYEARKNEFLEEFKTVTDPKRKRILESVIKGFGELTQYRAWIEVQVLYDWWVNVRPKRNDAMADIEYPDFYFVPTHDNPKYSTLETKFKSAEHEEKYENAQALDRELEHQYLEEDKAMMKRVIDISNRLWD